MAQFDELITILKEILNNRFYPKPEYIKGVLGDGLGNVRVPNRADYNYARFNRGSTESFEIFNKMAPEVEDWPILIGTIPWQPGLIQVVGTDWESYSQSGWGDSVSTSNPHAPTHVWRDGFIGADPLDIYLRAIAPARAYTNSATGSIVYVNSFEYHTGTIWPGTPGVDLQPLMSATPTGSALFAGVYVQPGNTLGVVTGTADVDTAAFDPPLVNFPWGTIPIARVRIYGGQAGLRESDFRDARRLFDFPATGTASSAVGGGVWPAPNKVMLWDVSASTAVEYDDLATALGDVETGDALVLGIGDFDLGAAQIANTVPLTIIGSGDRGSTITSSHATEIIHPSDDLTIINCYIDASGGGDGFTIDGVDVEIINCQYEIASGPGINGVNIGATSAANVTIKYSRIVVGGGTSIAVANNSSNLYIYAGYFGGGAAISHTGTPNIELYDTPTLVGTVSSLVEGVYIDASGNVILGPDAFVEFEERASAPSTPATGRWRLYTKSDGFYQVDDAGAETSLAQSGGGREVLTAQLDLYVATTGSDSNDGSSGSPFLTPQKAIDVGSSYDLSTYDVAISVADGTYTGAITLKPLVTSGGIVYITGNTTTPANCLLNVSTGNAVTASQTTGYYIMQGFRLQTSAASSAQVYCFNGSKIELRYMEFHTGYTAGTGWHLRCEGAGSLIYLQNSYTITGDVARHIDANQQGAVWGFNITVTCSGTRAFTIFAAAGGLGFLRIHGNTWTGAGSATGKRYDVSGNAYIRTDGATLPGNAAGTAATGGQYT